MQVTWIFCHNKPVRNGLPLVIAKNSAQNAPMRVQANHFKTVCRIILVTALLWAAPSAHAQSTASNQQLDQLFSQLKAASSKPIADQIARKIWSIWFNPSDKMLNARMNEIIGARTAFDTGRTLKLLDALVADYPDYAEGWNRRATLHYELGNYQKSLDDIAQTLALEPRHFGALSGQALVYLALSDTAKARAAANRARAIHPFIATNPPLSDLVEPRVRI